MQDGAKISATTAGNGAGGAIGISGADALVLAAGGQILSKTTGSGPGGEISINAAGNLTITGTAGSPAETGIIAETQGPGRAGSVAVSAGTLALSRQGEISSLTQGAGNTGDITVTTTGDLTVGGAGEGTEIGSGIGSQVYPNSSGNAGTVRVEAGSLTIRKGGLISSNTVGQGNAGQVEVTTIGSLTILDGGRISTDTFPISSDMFGSSTGNAGQVAVAAGSLTIRNAGVISS